VAGSKGQEAQAPQDEKAPKKPRLASSRSPEAKADRTKRVSSSRAKTTEEAKSEMVPSADDVSVSTTGRRIAGLIRRVSDLASKRDKAPEIEGDDQIAAAARAALEDIKSSHSAKADSAESDSAKAESTEAGPSESSASETASNEAASESTDGTTDTTEPDKDDR
jgi:hypothetical protein